MRRLVLAAAIAAGAVAPAAHAVPVCVTYGTTYAVCAETAKPGCVYGHTDRVAFLTEPCG